MFDLIHRNLHDTSYRGVYFLHCCSTFYQSQSPFPNLYPPLPTLLTLLNFFIFLLVIFMQVYKSNTKKNVKKAILIIRSFIPDQNECLMVGVGAVAMGHGLVLGSLRVQLQLHYLSLELVHDLLVHVGGTRQELQSQRQ